MYPRKSSESEDRQVQSIDDQIKALRKLAKDRDLKIVEILRESRSAKKPGRPVFDEMLARIEKGEADGILCWQINRLSRNPIDSGKISWMLQNGVIKSIQTIDKEYRPEDNVLLFNVESGMANQFIIDLRKSSKRGMLGKADRGWLPSRATIGYLNHTDRFEEKTIIEDPDRFNLVRKMWDLLFEGKNPTRILEIATKEWGLVTPKFKRSGGKPMSTSAIYKMFGNIFYTGSFMFAGKLYAGNHKAMITMEEYDRAQEILGKTGKARPSKHIHAYTGVIRCSECGCMHTACTKVKTIITTGETKEFTYYYCTRRKRNIVCSQTESLTEKQLEDQITKYVEGCEINPVFLNWALEYLEERTDFEIEDRTQIYKSQQEAYNRTQKELDNLTRMFYRELIDDEEAFKTERDVLRNQLTRLKQEMCETEDRADKWLELTEKTFVFSTYAKKTLLAEDTAPEQKKDILLGLGWNHQIKDQILCITKHKWLEPIENSYPALKQRYDRLELGKTLVTQRQSEEIASIRSTWGGYRESNPN